MPDNDNPNLPVPNRANLHFPIGRPRPDAQQQADAVVQRAATGNAVAPYRAPGTILTTMQAEELGRAMNQWEQITMGRGRATAPLQGAFADLQDFGAHVVQLATWMAHEAGYDVVAAGQRIVRHEGEAHGPRALPPGPQAPGQPNARARAEGPAAGPARPAQARIGAGGAERPPMPAEARVAFVDAAVRTAAMARFIEREAARLTGMGFMAPVMIDGMPAADIDDGLTAILGRATLHLPGPGAPIPDFDRAEIYRELALIQPQRRRPALGGRRGLPPGGAPGGGMGGRMLPPNRPRHNP